MIGVWCFFQFMINVISRFNDGWQRFWMVREHLKEYMWVVQQQFCKGNLDKMLVQMCMIWVNMCSDFKDVSDADHFIRSLREELRTLKDFSMLKRRVELGKVFSLPLISWSHIYYYHNQVPD